MIEPPKEYLWMCVVTTMLLFLIFCPLACAGFVPDTEDKEVFLAWAIWKSEGGYKARTPWGIQYKGCDWEHEDYCEKILNNTIRNNIKRWRKAQSKGYKEDYLSFLQSRYCPDGDGGCENWQNNVRLFLYSIDQ